MALSRRAAISAFSCENQPTFIEFNTHTYQLTNPDPCIYYAHFNTQLNFFHYTQQHNEQTLKLVIMELITAQ